MEAQLASQEAVAGKTYLRYVARMFREQIAMLDEAIKSAHTQRR